MLFKDISFLDIWRPLCSGEHKNLRNFSRGYHEKHFCEIILNLDKWFKSRCRLKDFSSRAPAALVFSGVEPFMHFGRGHYWEHSWFRRKCRLKKKFMQD